MSKLLNLLIGALVIALLAGVGALVYSYTKPAGAEQGSRERSLEAWRQQVNKNPDSALARANLGAAYLDLGQTQEAIRELKTALDQVPNSPTFMYQLALAYRQGGDPDKALDLFKRTVELFPAGEKYASLYQMAEVCWQKGDKVNAQSYLEQGIADNDVIWNSHYLLGQIFEQAGDKAKAKEEYQKAAKYNPSEELQAALKRVGG